MKLKDVNLKENEVLEIGYFNNKGREYLEGRRYQVVSGIGFELIKDGAPETEVYKTEKGYASKFIMKKKGLI